MEIEGIWEQYLQLEVNKMAYLKKFKKNLNLNLFFFTGAIDHAPWIILQVFTGAQSRPSPGRPF
jgi:hypothetical protein